MGGDLWLRVRSKGPQDPHQVWQHTARGRQQELNDWHRTVHPGALPRMVLGRLEWHDIWTRERHRVQQVLPLDRLEVSYRVPVLTLDQHPLALT